MPEVILFDLDDTLLDNAMDTFLPAYFRALTDYVSDLVPPGRLIAELMRATEVMEANDGSGATNEEVFASAFYPALECERATLEPVLEQFYVEAFPELRVLTRRRPEARKLIEWAFERDLQVAIATNPMFPRVAVEQRLAWAGVPVDDFDYALVTTYEHMHATKAHPAYYREILEKLGREPDECLMVGDSWEHDIAQAASVGIPVYWISGFGEVPPEDDVPLLGRGTLSDLWAQVRSGGLFS